MKRFFAPFFFFGLFFISPFFFPRVVFANPPIGINVAAKHGDLDRAAQIVGPGGWVVVMARPGDADTLQRFFNDHPEVNVVIRGHWPATVPDKNLAVSWTATLGKLDTGGKKLFFMPWNEPNMPREAGGRSDVNEVASMLKTYTGDLMNYFGRTGILHNKIEVLSPMINQSAPDFDKFVDALGGADYFRQFYGVSMNLYDFETDCGSQALCNSNPFLNTGGYREVLKRMGVPDALVFGLEVGIVDQSGTCPPQVTNCPVFEREAMDRLLSAFAGICASDPNCVMGSPLSYNPELSDHPDWLFGSSVEEFIKSLQDPNGKPIAITWNEELQKKFEQWLAEKIKSGLLSPCPGSQYGYGVSSSLSSICQNGGIPSSYLSPGEISDYFGETKGTFSFRDFVLFWPNRNESEANQEALANAAKEIIRSTKYDVSDNSKVADNLAAVNNKLIPPEVKNKSEEKESQGEVRLELCIKGTTDWYYPKETIKLAIPPSYQKASTNGRQVAGFISPPGTGSLFFADVGGEGGGYFAKKDDFQKNRFLAAKLEMGKVLGTGDEKNGQPKKIKKNGYVRIGPDGRAIYSLVIDTYPGVGDVTVEVWANGQKVGLLSGPNNVSDPNAGGRLWVGNRGSGAWYENNSPVMNGIFAKDGKDLAISFRIKYNYKGKSDENGGADLTCTVSADGSSSCSETPPPLPSPPPKECAPASDNGINIGQKGTDPNGQVPVFFRKVAGADEVTDTTTVQQPVYGDIMDQAGNIVQGVLYTITNTVTRILGWQKEVTIIVNFYSSIPFTLPDEGVQRLGVYGKTCLPGTCPDFAHGRSADNEFMMESVNSRGSDKTVGDVDAYTYGQGGPDKMWDYNLDPLKGMLNPPDFGGL